MKPWLCGLFLLVAVLIAGCGGSGGGASPSVGFARPRLSIAWGARSRDVAGPSSALSAVILLQDASRRGEDVVFTVDRSGPPAGSTVVYTGPEEVRTALTALTVRFHAGPGGNGPVVGIAYGVVPLGDDGTISPWVTNAGVVQSVQVPEPQSVRLGTPRTLEFTVADGDGNLVAVTPGSARWTVLSGGDRLAIESGEAVARALGTAKVTATVDGRTSAPATVWVETPEAITVEIEPKAPTSLVVDGSQTLTAVVANAVDKSVVWSVDQPSGGTVSATGIYTAPAVPGTYTVRATSVVNPAKSATKPITVILRQTLREMLEADPDQVIGISGLTLLRPDGEIAVSGEGAIRLASGQVLMWIFVGLPHLQLGIATKTVERVRLQVQGQTFTLNLAVSQYEPNGDGTMIGGILIDTP
ncbi:MAG: Ig-like domain-containing protein [Fimbriimonas sp.]